MKKWLFLAGILLLPVLIPIALLLAFWSPLLLWIYFRAQLKFALAEIELNKLEQQEKKEVRKKAPPKPFND